VELVTSLAEHLPVVLPVLEEPPGAIKLGSQTLDRHSRACTGCSWPAGSAKATPQRDMHLAGRHQLRQLVMDRILEQLALEHACIAPRTRGMDCGTVPSRDVAAVVALNPSLAAIGLAVHGTAAAGAQKDRGQRIGVLGPGLAGAPDVALLHVLAGSPGLLVDQRGRETLNAPAFEEDLAGV